MKAKALPRQRLQSAKAWESLPALTSRRSRRAKRAPTFASKTNTMQVGTHNQSNLDQSSSFWPIVLSSNFDLMLVEKRVQCHIQATNKFPSKLGLIIERAPAPSNKRESAEHMRLKTISNPK